MIDHSNWMMTGMISSISKPHDAVALLPLALLLTIVVVANLLILIPYIKKHLSSGKAGLVTMFHDGAYFLSFISLVMLPITLWESFAIPAWTIFFPLMYVCFGMAIQFICTNYHQCIRDPNTTGAMKGFYVFFSSN
ncbi:hypothetical protein [Vibrio sp. 10N.239.312.D08]|uniref:hypothetical protein n=1 Tax=Vibrio sp. 10N.239.312.D08 TaxID=3229978 RepID=UPI003551094A